MFKTVFPNKVFDYMAAGRPTILGIDGVIREVIEHAKGGIFIEPSNENRLIAAEHAAKALAQTRFDREEMARKFENVLLRAVNPDVSEKRKSAVA